MPGMRLIQTVNAIEVAAKHEYETTHSGTWDDATWEDQIVYYASARRIIEAYLESITQTVVKSEWKL